MNVCGGLPRVHHPSEARCQDWSNKYTMGSERDNVCVFWLALQIYAVYSNIKINLYSPPITATS